MDWICCFTSNASNLVVAPFLDCVLACFGALAKVLTNQKNFFSPFEKLSTKVLIDYRITLQYRL